MNCNLLDIEPVQDWVNKQSWWSYGEADIACLDRKGAEKVAEAYWMVFTAYPQLAGKFAAPNTDGDFDPSTYAWCYYDNGKVQLNPLWWNDWDKLQTRYERDVKTGWHPKGTDARAIIIHELGHAVEGMLTNAGILAGYDTDWRLHATSEALRDQLFQDKAAIRAEVSTYATMDAHECFAELFAEYVCSEEPRPAAVRFGKILDELLREAELRQ